MHPGAWAPQLERENPYATTREKPAHHNEEPMLQWMIPCASTKILHAATKTQRSQKTKKKRKENCKKTPQKNLLLQYKIKIKKKKDIMVSEMLKMS